MIKLTFVLSFDQNSLQWKNVSCGQNVSMIQRCWEAEKYKTTWERVLHICAGNCGLEWSRTKSAVSVLAGQFVCPKSFGGCTSLFRGWYAFRVTICTQRGWERWKRFKVTSSRSPKKFHDLRTENSHGEGFLSMLLLKKNKILKLFSLIEIKRI